MIFALYDSSYRFSFVSRYYKVFFSAKHRLPKLIELYMKKISLACCMLLIILNSDLYAQKEPWFTGPLIFDSAEITPVGSQFLQLTNQFSNSRYIYDYNGTRIPIPLASTDNIILKYAYGLSSKMDMELDMLYMGNQTLGQSKSGIGDTAIELGYQVLTQGNSHWRPNFRVALIELFPTGRYNQLNPTLLATDATGSGSYQTSVGLNFDLLTQFSGTEHYLKTSGSITAIYANSVKLRGDNIYGGAQNTRGRINPGNAIVLDLAAEYTLTQNWVAVLESFVLAQQASDFSGELGSNPSSFKTLITSNIRRRGSSLTPEQLIDDNRAVFQSNHIRPSNRNIGSGQDIGNGNLYELSLAPAIEYNFSENIGIIGGCWFTVEGANTPYFFSSVIQLDTRW